MKKKKIQAQLLKEIILILNKNQIQNILKKLIKIIIIMIIKITIKMLMYIK